ncbi:hypothetical protein MUO32_20050 [Shinella sp. CPCC 101442]|uniref:hypothetical protein n=1 Tax=Shinella sp. CPCC 101442 TaxID=2932265 RepID=UPI002152B8C1|nr:hypothetical protein [Shinella sp. CPCC 101442]MCR6501331.1 hypothetical protein [Shinella sp. CPCC 101442]
MESLAPGIPITDAAIATLSLRPWPGNIRELRTTLQRALLRRRAPFVDESCFEDIGIPAHADQDSCDLCRSRPLSRAKCREIRSVYRATACNISQTARKLDLSRTTVYKHVREK